MYKVKMSNCLLTAAFVLGVHCWSSWTREQPATAAELPLHEMTGDDVRPDVTGKKIILATREFYGSPVAEWSNKLKRMQSLAFDGVVLNLFPADNPDGMKQRWWGIVPYTKEMFQEEIDLIKSLLWARYTDNFIWVGTRTEKTRREPFNWFSDEDAKVWLANARLLGEIARECGAKGIILDTEQYLGADYGAWRGPFDYRQYAAGDWQASSLGETEPHSYLECAAKVRERGKQWGEAISSAYRDVTILSLRGLHSAARGTIIRYDYPSKRTPYSHSPLTRRKPK